MKLRSVGLCGFMLFGYGFGWLVCVFGWGIFLWFFRSLFRLISQAGYVRFVFLSKISKHEMVYALSLQFVTGA